MFVYLFDGHMELSLGETGLMRMTRTSSEMTNGGCKIFPVGRQSEPTLQPVVPHELHVLISGLNRQKDLRDPTQLKEVTLFETGKLSIKQQQLTFVSFRGTRSSENDLSPTILLSTSTPFRGTSEDSRKTLDPLVWETEPRVLSSISRTTDDCINSYLSVSRA